jgi:hypothetical protein
MPKTGRPNTMFRRVSSPTAKSTSSKFRPFQNAPAARPKQLLWAKYQTALAKKRRLLVLHRHNDRLEPVYGSAYDILWDIAHAILEARPTCDVDRAVQARDHRPA